MVEADADGVAAQVLAEGVLDAGGRGAVDDGLGGRCGAVALLCVGFGCSFVGDVRGQFLRRADGLREGVDVEGRAAGQDGCGDEQEGCADGIAVTARQERPCALNPSVPRRGLFGGQRRR